MKRMFISLAAMAVSLFSQFALSELSGLSDQELHDLHGQINAADVRRNFNSGQKKAPSSDINTHVASDLQSRVSPQNLIGLDTSDLQLSQGIELDLKIQTSFDFEYIDDDGIGEDNNGAAGSLFLSGVNIGSSESPLTTDQIQSEQPFSESDLALVNDIIIEVDPQAGMFISIEELGDKYGNGIDVVINDVYLGNKDVSAGSFVIEDVSNFVQDSNVTKNNQLFGMNLSTLDDGKATVGGNWVPFQTKVLPIAGASESELSVTVPGQDLGFPNLSANTVIDASFVLSIDKVAWVDDGNEFGLSGIMIYQGIDTDNDGVDDTVGPARLTQMKIETVDHKAIDGSDVKALYIENLDFKADIAIQSIYVGSPEHSLGALHIKGLDTSGTSLWIYPH